MRDYINLIKNFFILTWQRIKSDTPRYWKRVSNLFLLLGAAASYLSANPEIVPEKYKYVLQLAAAFTFGSGLVSRLTTTNEELSKKSNDALLKENAGEKLDNI